MPTRSTKKASKKTTKRAAPKPTASTAKAKAKGKTAAKKAVSKSAAKPPAKKKATPKRAPKTSAKPVAASVAAPTDVLADFVGRIEDMLLSGLKAMRETVLEALVKPELSAPAETPAPGDDPDLDQLTRAFHRTLADVLEQRSEGLGVPLATIHGRLAALASDDGAADASVREQLALCAADLAGVLERLDIERFEPVVGEVFDPLIHTAVADEPARDVEAGRVCRVVAAGYASVRGRILVPSRVVLSRG